MGKLKGLYRRGMVWWLMYAGPDGRMRYESAKTTSQKEAEYLLACRRKEVQEGKLPEVKKIAPNYTFRELAGAYLIWMKRQKSFISKKNKIGQLLEVFGSYHLSSFTSRLIERYQIKRLETCKPATVNRLLVTIKHMFTKAVEWEMVNEEVLKKVRKVKQLPEKNRRLRFLSSEECQALIKFTPTPFMAQFRHSHQKN